jgi:hypothetical protein
VNTGGHNNTSTCALVAEDEEEWTGIDTLLADGELSKRKQSKQNLNPERKTGRDASALPSLSLVCSHMPFDPRKTCFW